MEQLDLRAVLDGVNHDIEACLGSIAELQRDLDGLRQLAAYLQRKLESRPVQPSTPPSEPTSIAAADSAPRLPGPVATPVPSAAPLNFAEMTQVDAAEAVLREAAPRPLKIGEIIDRMHEKGFPRRVERHILFNSLYTSMKKARGRFRKAGEVGRGLWCLADGNPGIDEEPTPPGMDDDDPDDYPEDLDETEPEHSGDGPRNISYTEAAETLIRRLGRPVRTGEVADYLIEQGHKDPSKRKFICNTAYNCLTGSANFVKTRDGGWDLVSHATQGGQGAVRTASASPNHVATR